MQGIGYIGNGRAEHSARGSPEISNSRKLLHPGEKEEGRGGVTGAQITQGGWEPRWIYPQGAGIIDEVQPWLETLGGSIRASAFFLPSHLPPIGQT